MKLVDRDLPRRGNQFAATTGPATCGTYPPEQRARIDFFSSRARATMSTMPQFKSGWPPWKKPSGEGNLTERFVAGQKPRKSEPEASNIRASASPRRRERATAVVVRACARQAGVAAEILFDQGALG